MSISNEIAEKLNEYKATASLIDAIFNLYIEPHHARQLAYDIKQTFQINFALIDRYTEELTDKVELLSIATNASDEAKSTMLNSTFTTNLGYHTVLYLEDKEIVTKEAMLREIKRREQLILSRMKPSLLSLSQSFAQYTTTQRKKGNCTVHPHGSHNNEQCFYQKNNQTEPTALNSKTNLAQKPINTTEPTKQIVSHQKSRRGVSRKNCSIFYEKKTVL
ncbi:hypothetical protein M153_7240003181 [Pseudoloma neurophilia]|uniref:Uncharacterized protein n=1 Tax=Pseudoloma neurophilia TaxID=146866 RepID=A0A0R0LW61_9MICR|nr:hypothetical protein M153_7240003181 [Pseudoloma neurophilia]